MDVYEHENRWQSRLRAVSLVGQVDFSDEECELACNFVGQKFQTKIDSDRRLYFQQFPAALVIAITAAARDYESGSFWPKLAHRLGMSALTQPNQSALSTLYSHALDQLGLERFSTPRSRIGEMIVHATIPDSSLGLFTQKLIAQFKKNSAVTGQEIVEAFQSIQRGKVQANEINVPILDFVLDSGDFAAYFIDECLSLIAAVAAKKDTEAMALGIASHYRNIVLDAAAQAKISTTNLRSSNTRSQRARFELDPITQRLFVTLPVRSDQKQPEPWAIKWGDLELEEFSFPLIAGHAEPKRVPLLRPGHQAVLTNKQSGEEIALSLWTDSSPYALFDSQGLMLAGSGSIRSDSVYALFSGVINQSPSALLANGQADFKSQILGAPAGWNQDGNAWKLLQVATKDIRWFSIAVDGQTLPASERRVSAQQSPKLHDLTSALGAAVPNYGNVTSTVPAIWLPPVGPTESFAWRIELVQDETGKRVLEELVASGGDESRVELPADLVDGLYSVRVEGRRGSRITFVFALVRDLALDFQHKVRLFDRATGKLQPTSMQLSAAKCSLAELEFGLGEVSRHFEISGLKVLIEPPRIQVRLDTEEASKLLVGRADLDSTMLVETSIRVSWPAAIAASVVARVAESSGKITADQLKPSSEGPGFAEFKLNKISDSVTAKRISWLELCCSFGETAIGRISPPNLLESCSITPGDYRLTLAADPLPFGLKAAFFSVYASWREPVIVDISSKYPEVPEDVLNAGPFKVVFQIDDGWTPLVWSRRNGGNPNSYSLNAALPIQPTTPELALVYWLLTGEKNDAMLAAVPQPVLWRCLTDPSVESPKVTRDEVARFCREHLDADPDLAFQHFPSEIHNRDSHLKLMFLADVIDESPSEPALHLLTLSNAASAPALYAAAAAGQLKPGDDAFENAIDIWLGDPFSSITEQSESPASAIQQRIVRQSQWLGNQQDNVRWLLSLPEENLAAVSQMFGFDKPAPVLSVGMCATQVIAVNRRADYLWERLALAKSSRYLNEFASAFADVVKESGLETELEPLIKSRSDWPSSSALPLGPRAATANVAQLSLKLAILCRLAARGVASASETWHFFKTQHQVLSQTLPQLVELDVLLAEIYLCQLHMAGDKNE